MAVQEVRRFWLAAISQGRDQGLQVREKLRPRFQGNFPAQLVRPRHAIANV